MCRITCYLTVSQTDQTARPFHDLRTMDGKDKRGVVSTIELFHYSEESGSSGRIKIRCGFVR